MSDLSRTTIDGLGTLGIISNEDAAKLPATTRMFLEASPDWEKRACGWWRKGIEGGREYHLYQGEDLGDTMLGLRGIPGHWLWTPDQIAVLRQLDCIKPLTATAAAALQRARNEAQRQYNAICSRNRVVCVEPQPFNLPLPADRPALRFNRIKPHEDRGTDWMAGLHTGGPR